MQQPHACCSILSHDFHGYRMDHLKCMRLNAIQMLVMNKTDYNLNQINVNCNSNWQIGSRERIDCNINLRIII